MWITTLESWFKQFSSQCDSRVIIYGRKLFIRLTTRSPTLFLFGFFPLDRNSSPGNLSKMIRVKKSSFFEFHFSSEKFLISEKRFFARLIFSNFNYDSLRVVYTCAFSRWCELVAYWSSKNTCSNKRFGLMISRWCDIVAYQSSKNACLPMRFDLQYHNDAILLVQFIKRNGQLTYEIWSLAKLQQFYSINP